MNTSFWALTAAYWLHMLATVVWIGGLAALALFVLPAVRQALQRDSYSEFLENLQRRLERLGWFSLITLAATGMFQMSANPNYRGFLAIESRWAAAILFKHLLFLGMVGLLAYQTWFLLPQMRRIAIRKTRLDEGDPSARALFQGLKRREDLLMRASLILAVLILALTAVARSV